MPADDRREERMKSHVDTVVSILFIFDYLLCECPKLCIFVNNTQHDAYHKGFNSNFNFYSFNIKFNV
jgi:hypothetical protein